jgi:hypothetical protein
VGGIYLIGEGGDLVEMTKTSYGSESLLQEVLAEYPTGQ